MNTILHFTATYKQQRLSSSLSSFQQLFLEDMEGVRGYCDKDAVCNLRAQLSEISLDGVHFLDSGNYHYVSLFFLEKITCPFTLVVFDHHTDMQPSMFGDLLSCGSWIYHAARTLPLLREIILIGVGEESLLGTKEMIGSEQNSCDPAILKLIVSDLNETEEIFSCLLHRPSLGKLPVTILKENAHSCTDISSWTHFPVYLSIDKDVLSLEDAHTDWDQGSMRLSDLEDQCRLLYSSQHILGMDICGEPDPLQCSHSDLERSREINLRLQHFYCTASTR